MVRYSVLRLLVFLGCIAILWLLGLRDRDEQLALIAGAALLSMVISFFALKPFREQYSRELAQKVDARRAARAERVTDEQVEDAETAGPAEATKSDEPEAGPEQYR